MKEFESRLERLEGLAEKIKNHELPLEEAIRIFEEGMKLSKTLKKDLEKMEAKVEILLNGPEDSGPKETGLFEEEDS